MIEKKWKCDFCKEELIESRGIPVYILELSTFALPDHGNTCLDVSVRPPIGSTKHFCGLGCLKNWLEQREK